MKQRRTAAAAIVLATIGCTAPAAHRPVARSPVVPTRPPAHARTIGDSVVNRRVLLGYSVQHRSITAIQLGDPDSPRRVLIVGCVHGSEPAGIAIARALSSARLPAEIDLWLVPDLNPDGVVAGTRTNARGVDLNRNFPYQWQRLGPPGNLHYAGPHALSEPESILANRLLNAVRPTLGIWYHQALNVVDDSQGPGPLERRYAALTGLPLQPLPDYPGSAVGYEDHLFGPTAFVVELPAGPVTGRQLAAHVRAVLDLAVHANPASA